MEALDLRYLVECAEAGTLTLAARSLGVEVSTISRRVASLEDEIGISLFERNRSGIRLTRGGHAVLNHARRVLLELDAIKRIGQQHASGSIGDIRLGVRMPPAGGPAQELLVSWHKAYPEISISVIEGSHRELALALSEHHLDVVLITGHTMWPKVTACTLYKERIYVALPEAHPLGLLPQLHWSALTSERILMQGGDENHTQREFYAMFLGNNVDFREHSASKDTIIALVGAGFGISFVTTSQAEAIMPGVICKPVSDDSASLEFSLAWLPETEDPLVGRFVAFMRDESRARGFV
jgi:DNA-binding transcriptional LysR family regulator